MWCNGVCDCLTCQVCLHKQAMLCLQGAAALQEAFCSYIGFTVGPCLRLGRDMVVTARRVQRLFFLAEGQDISRFLVTNLGITKYPDYRYVYHLPAITT